MNNRINPNIFVVLVTVVFLFFVCQSRARTITVGSEPGHEFNNIQAAINVSTTDDTIIVADGIYTGSGNHDIDFQGKEITVCSERGPETCTINCKQQGRGFIFQSGEKEFNP
ncbi:MAG: hypothetical protein ACYSTT_24315 [Planctomycetota bacterium]